MVSVEPHPHLAALGHRSHGVPGLIRVYIEKENRKVAMESRLRDVGICDKFSNVVDYRT